MTIVTINGYRERVCGGSFSLITHISQASQSGHTIEFPKSQ